MVASTVYYFQDQLKQICGVLSGFDYEVWNSHIGTIPVDPGLSNLENCVIAARNCDVFLGIVRPFYGSGVVGDRSIMHEECLEAVRLKKPNARLREPKWASSALETRLTFFSHPSGSPADDLTARQQQILELIKQRKQLHAGELLKLLGSEVTDRTVRNDLHAMVHRGWLVRRGRGRSTSYAEAATAGRK
jgi:hypothetical protein